MLGYLFLPGIQLSAVKSGRLAAGCIGMTRVLVLGPQLSGQLGVLVFHKVDIRGSPSHGTPPPDLLIQCFLQSSGCLTWQPRASRSAEAGALVLNFFTSCWLEQVTYPARSQEEGAKPGQLSVRHGDFWQPAVSQTTRRYFGGFVSLFYCHRNFLKLFLAVRYFRLLLYGSWFQCCLRKNCTIPRLENSSIVSFNTCSALIFFPHIQNFVSCRFTSFFKKKWRQELNSVCFFFNLFQCCLWENPSFPTDLNQHLYCLLNSNVDAYAFPYCLFAALSLFPCTNNNTLLL